MSWSLIIMHRVIQRKIRYNWRHHSSSTKSIIYFYASQLLMHWGFRTWARQPKYAMHAQGHCRQPLHYGGGLCTENTNLIFCDAKLHHPCILPEMRVNFFFLLFIYLLFPHTHFVNSNFIPYLLWEWYANSLRVNVYYQTAIMLGLSVLHSFSVVFWWPALVKSLTIRNSEACFYET